MVAISFSEPKHYDKLINRKKKQTIRPRNPKRIEQMKRLGIQIYWKQRTPEREKLYDAKYEEGFIVLFDYYPKKYSYPDKSWYVLLKPEEFDFEEWEWTWNLVPFDKAEQIAIKDGFDTYYEMQNWFYNKYGPLVLKQFDLIRWKEVK